ncbi:MAG: efflux RND transporter periplasmic adaptor subunit [Spirochaetales bacterium]|nr:efflux RND transporter periplasmic adaptor subunit [Spirochaetales bacterium]
MKRTSLFIFGMIVVSLFLFSCARDDAASGATYNPEESDDRPIAVEGQRVQKSLLINQVRGGGMAEGIREAWVVSETEGIIVDVDFSLGDRVRVGQSLLAVDSDLARRKRDLANQQYKTAMLEYQAAEKSMSNGSMAELQFSQTADRLLAAENSMAQAEEAFQDTQLRAPFDGAVASRGSDLGIGNYLSRGVRVARIVDDSSFQTELSIGEGQVLALREGALAQVTGSDGLVREGTLSALSAGGDGGTGSFTAVVVWSPLPGDRMRSGMSVDVAIEAFGDNLRPIIPAIALRTREGRPYAYVAEEGLARPQELVLGARIGDRVEVLSGLEAGEILITSGLSSLVPGSRVAVSLVEER